MVCQKEPLYGHHEFLARHPALSRRIGDLCPGQAWCLTGVSALLRDEAGLWVELSKPKHWMRRDDGATVIGLGAIGGSLEPGESSLECLRREAWEEVGAPLELLPAKETIIVYEERQIVRQAGLDVSQPWPALMTVSANRSNRQRLPKCEVLAIATYWASAAETPRLADLYGLLHIPHKTLVQLLAAPEVCVETLLSLPGVEAQLAHEPPARAVVRPVWTMRSLQLALESGFADLK